MIKYEICIVYKYILLILFRTIFNTYIYQIPLNTALITEYNTVSNSSVLCGNVYTYGQIKLWNNSVYYIYFRLRTTR